MENTLTAMLIGHAPLLRVSACSKRWSTRKVAIKQVIYGRKQRLYLEVRVGSFTPRVEQNFYYYTVHRAKYKCWIAILQGANQVMRES